VTRDEGSNVGRQVAAACGIAVFLRLALAFVHVDPLLNPDALAFRDLARSFAATGRLAYVDQGAPGVELFAFRSLLYPLFLASMTAGGSFAPALVAQALLGVAIVPLMALLAIRAYGPRVAIATAWIGACYAGTIFNERQIASEALFTPLLVAAAVLASGVRRLPAALFAGVLFGAAALVRPAGLVAGLAVAAVLALFPPESGAKHRRRGASLAAALLAGLGLALAPPMARNAARVGSPVLLTSGGMNFWIGNGRGTVGEAWEVMAREAPRRGELGTDRYFYADMWAHSGEILCGAPRLFASKVAMYFSPLPRGAWNLSWRFLLPLAAIGWWWARTPRDPRAAGLLLAILVSQTALALAAVPWSRYRAPMEPFLWPWAAAACLGLWDDRKVGRPLLWALLLGSVALIVVQVVFGGGRT